MKTTIPNKNEIPAYAGMTASKAYAGMKTSSACMLSHRIIALTRYVIAVETAIPN